MPSNPRKSTAALWHMLPHASVRLTAPLGTISMSSIVPAECAPCVCTGCSPLHATIVLHAPTIYGVGKSLATEYTSTLHHCLFFYLPLSQFTLTLSPSKSLYFILYHRQFCSLYLVPLSHNFSFPLKHSRTFNFPLLVAPSPLFFFLSLTFSCILYFLLPLALSNFLSLF